MQFSKLKILKSLFILFLFFTLSSCKKSDQNTNQDNTNTETAVIDEQDFAEKDEDLLNVDYKVFYDELAPHGEWIEVTDKDIGVEMKKSSSSLEKPHRIISISELFGVKEAFAGDVSFGAFFIWRPSPNIAVSVVAGEPEPKYVPYTNGQWIYTDAGWYFQAATPYEDICHHHGRWVYSPALGWVWVPGRVWAPAWVEWRESEGFTAWTPVPPGIYIVNNTVVCPPIDDERYFIVDNRHFCEPHVYKYKYMYKENKNKIMIKEMIKTDGVMIKEKTIINKGPDVMMIEKDRGSKIEMVKISRVKDKSEAKYEGKEIKSYSPEFKKINTKAGEKSNAVKPGKYESFSDVKNKIKSEEKSNDKSDKKESSADSKGSDKKLNDIKGKSKGDDKQSGKYKDDDKYNGKKKDKGKNDDKNKPEGDVNKDKGKNNDAKQKNNSGKENKGGKK